MFVSVQFSIYPLREKHLSPAISRVVEIIKGFGLPVETGLMSSTTYGESKVVFKAFKRVYDEVSLASHVAIIMTLSNACPLPEKTRESLKRSV